MDDTPLELLWSREPVAPARQPVERAYGSAIAFPDTRPYVVANFVETIDGVVVFGERGGWNASSVSLDSAIDRLVMGLLRTQADAIVIGAGTHRAAPRHQWSPGGIAPDAADALDDLREQTRGTRERAPLFVVSASGRLDAAHVTFTAPETRPYVITTAVGAARLEGTLPSTVEIIAVPAGPEIDPATVVRIVSERCEGLILCEGGPTLLGDLLRGGLVDELFLTVAPQLAGRDPEHRRLGLMEGFAATPEEAPRTRLHSLRRAGDHLFLRYAR